MKAHKSGDILTLADLTMAGAADAPNIIATTQSPAAAAHHH